MIDSRLGFEINNTIELFETVLHISGSNGTITVDNDGNYIQWAEKPIWNQPTKKWALFYENNYGCYIFLHENMEDYEIESIVSELTRRLGDPIPC